MSNKEVVISVRNELLQLFKKLRDNGILDNSAIRYSLIEYNLMKCVGQLNMMIEELSDEED